MQSWISDENLGCYPTYLLIYNPIKAICKGYTPATFLYQLPPGNPSKIVVLFQGQPSQYHDNFYSY